MPVLVLSPAYGPEFGPVSGGDVGRAGIGSTILPDMAARRRTTISEFVCNVLNELLDRRLKISSATFFLQPGVCRGPTR